MALISFTLISLATMGTFTVGIFAGGLICNWEEARKKNLAEKANGKNSKTHAA